MPTSNIRQATNVEPKVLVAQNLSATENFAYYTVPADTSVKIATASVCNHTASAGREVFLSVVRSGGTAGTSNRVANFYLQPMESTSVNELAGMLLGPGDVIAGHATVSSSVAFVITGAVSS
jgi:hypothetical protein